MARDITEFLLNAGTMFNGFMDRFGSFRNLSSPNRNGLIKPFVGGFVAGLGK